MRKKLTITKREAIRLHRKMWKWLAKHPTKKKSEWPGMKYYVRADCFLCEYSRNFGEECLCCPLDWEVGSCLCPRVGYFSLWYKARGKKRAALALKIANLKERKVTWSKKKSTQ